MNTLLIEQNNIRTAPLYESGLVHMRDSYSAAFGAAALGALPWRAVKGISPISAQCLG